MIIKNSIGPSLLNQTNFIKEGMVPIELLRFYINNSIHPITIGMNPIWNMNHKIKCLLN